MYNILAVSYGEIFLKGKNRGKFEQKLIDQIRFALKDFKNVKVYKDIGKIFIETEHEEDMEQIIEKTRKVFGIVVISPSIKVKKDQQLIKNKAKELFGCLLKKGNIKTFKINTKRSDKSFPIKSMDFSAMIGEEILNAYSDVSVDVHNPDLEIFVDIKGDCYISSERIKTLGGLPIGITGKALLLLSGGIDSPVAGYMIAKRGVELSAPGLHAQSPPRDCCRRRRRALVHEARRGVRLRQGARRRPQGLGSDGKDPGPRHEVPPEVRRPRGMFRRQVGA
jgi:thiamine biosynthesis protein ThiI